MSKTQLAEVLTTRRTCREKLPTFFGSFDNHYHGFRECVNNAIDEINENFDGGEITIELIGEDKYRITDTGRGIPLFKEDNYKKIFETLFAGTKYGKSKTSGTNGLGLTVLNYTSKHYRITSRHDGIEEYLLYEDGGKNVDKGSRKHIEGHGTTIEYVLDDEVYTEIKFDVNELLDQVKLFSVISPKVTFHVIADGKQTDFHYDDFTDYFDSFTHTSSIIRGESTTVSDKEEDTLIGCISTQVTPFQMTYLNGNTLKDKGSIYDGVISGARKFFNELGKKYTLQDIRDSLGFIIDFRSDTVEYENQTKYATKKKVYGKIAEDYIYYLLNEENVKNPNNIKKMMSHIDTVYKANSNSDKAREKLRKELTKKIDKIGETPGKLKNCDAKGEEAELFICEGDSAQSGHTRARDSSFQASFAIRGKFINVLKTTEKKVLSNEEVKNVIQILGISYGRNLDLTNLNFGKIILMADADADGYAITCLLLNFFWKYMPQLLTEGRVYKTETPLFEIRDKNDKMFYAFSDKERDEIVKKIKGAKISRCKGIGEQDSEVLWETALCPGTRNLTQFKVSNEEEFNKKMREWFDTDVEPRKKLISENEINVEEME